MSQVEDLYHLGAQHTREAAVAARPLDGRHRRVDEHPHAAALQRRTDLGADLRVDGGHHRGQALDECHVDVAVAQRVGHLEADVARADDDGVPYLWPGESVRDDQCVVDGVQQVHAVELQSRDRRTLGHGSRGQDQRVVLEADGRAGRVMRQDRSVVGVDADDMVLDMDVDAGGLDLRQRAVGEVGGIGDLAADQVGQPADRVVRPAVRQQQVDPRAGIDFAGAQRGADARIAAADDDQPRHEADGLVGACARTGRRPRRTGRQRRRSHRVRRSAARG